MVETAKSAASLTKYHVSLEGVSMRVRGLGVTVVVMRPCKKCLEGISLVLGSRLRKECSNII